MKKKKTPLKDPKGGLTAAGRKDFAEREGSHLRPGVKGRADTPEKMKRKGSFLRRHFAHPRGPMRDEKGRPTRLALSAHAWGEPVPKTAADAKKLASKGARLLDGYAKAKKTAASSKSHAPKKRSKAKSAKKKNSLVENINRRKRAGKSRPKSAHTVSRASYSQMRKGWPRTARKKAAKKASKTRAKKTS